MRKIFLILGTELLISAAFAFLVNGANINYHFFTALGLGNLIIGVVGGIAGLIISAGEKRDRSLLIASGLLLLLGCLTCSIFPIQINSPRPV